MSEMSVWGRARELVVRRQRRRHCMLDHSKNVVVSGGSLTVVHGNSITYEGQHADYPTSSRARIQGKMSSISSYSVTDFLFLRQD